MEAIVVSPQEGRFSIEESCEKDEDRFYYRRGNGVFRGGGLDRHGKERIARGPSGIKSSC